MDILPTKTRILTSSACSAATGMSRQRQRRSTTCSAATRRRSSENITLTRRNTLLFTALSASFPSIALAGQGPQNPQPDTTITDRVYLDITECPNAFLRADERCDVTEPLGRIVIGLYGRHVPHTVANFKAMCTGTAGSSYQGTLIHRLFPGEFFMAGRQGPRERCEVMPPTSLQMNPETLEASAFALRHSRPGTVSLCVSVNDDEDEYRLSPSYRNVEFLVTTGPAPCPRLDGNNIVFGTVLEGMDVVSSIATVPIYEPGERIKQLNDFAEFLRDERAQNARNLWNRPLKSLIISSCGDFQVLKKALPPVLP